jgi:hypothetical protein
MSTRDIVALTSFGVGLSGAFLANMLILMMIGEINRKTSEERLISYFGYTLSKVVRIFREYRSAYPEGKLHVYTFAAIALAVFSMLSFAISFGIIG